MASKKDIAEDSFSSDEELSDGQLSESSEDIDAKLEEEDVFDVEFLKCYSALKKKDHKIYDESVRFFTEQDESSIPDNHGEMGNSEGGDSKISSKNKSNVPKMTLLDHQIAINQEEIEEPQLSGPLKIDLNHPVSKSFYDKELEEIKKSIEEVNDNIDSDSDNDDLLIVKKGSSSDVEAKSSRAINSMLDKLEEDEDISHLKQVWSDPDNLSAEDRFLRDYILNKRYLASNVDESEDESQQGFFSKNLDELPDNDTDTPETTRASKSLPTHHSDEKGFDQIARIPRNSTKTIRDLVEKREKKEKRLKKLQKEKKRKKVMKDADFEDIVGDIATRFHYEETEPNDYGLSAEELLVATDEELDKWVELNKVIAHKTREEELTEKQRFEARRNDIALKRSIFKSIYGDSGEDQDLHTVDKPDDIRSKRKRKRSDSKPSNVDSNPPNDSVEESKRKKKKRKRGTNHKTSKVGVAPDRLLAYGLSKTKLKRSKLL